MNKKILMIAGKLQAGKNSLADKIVMKRLQSNLDALVVAFADDIKQNLSNIFGLSLDMLYGTNEDKNKLTHLWWQNEQLTYRRAMQVYGSDICRKMDKYCWARSAYYTIREYDINFNIITDLRMSDELDYVEEKSVMDNYEVKTIKLSRDIGVKDNHESETQLDGIPDNRFSLIVPPNYDENQTFDLADKHLTEWNFYS